MWECYRITALSVERERDDGARAKWAHVARVRTACHTRRVISRTPFARCNCHGSGSHCQRDSEIFFVLTARAATPRRTVRGNERVRCRLSFAFAHHDFASAQGTRDAASTMSVWFGSRQQEGRQSPHRPSSASRRTSATGEHHGIPRTIPACEAGSGTREKRESSPIRMLCLSDAAHSRQTGGGDASSPVPVEESGSTRPARAVIRKEDACRRTSTTDADPHKRKHGSAFFYMRVASGHARAVRHGRRRESRGAASGLLLLRGDVAGRALQSSSCCEPAEQRVRRSACRTAVRGGARTILAPRPSCKGSARRYR